MREGLTVGGSLPAAAIVRLGWAGCQRGQLDGVTGSAVAGKRLEAPPLYAILRPVDAEWVNRGGILAEAISFLLIAPEIIGIERIRRAENRLEHLFGRRGSDAYIIVRGREPPFSPGFGAVEPGWLLYVALAIGTTAVMMGLLVLAFVIWGFDAGIWIGALGTLYLALLVTAVWAMRRRELSRLARLLVYLIMVPMIPPMWVSVLVAKGIHILLVGLIATATRLLRGPERLRALVFGTGVVLLFGGMGAQFVSTF